jgi:hypothetical protein
MPVRKASNVSLFTDGWSGYGGNHWLNATGRLDTKNPISECNRGDALRVNVE